MTPAGGGAASGLVAVVAVDGGPPVREEEVAALARDYVALRPYPPPTPPEGDDRARVVRFAPVGGRPPADAGGASASAQAGAHTDADGPAPASWRATCGALHASSASAAAPVRGLLAEADGQFALVAHDAAAGEVLVANDPMGMRAVHIARTPGRLLVSTSASSLARHLGCAASPLGLRTFLLGGYHFGARTHWDAVRRLDPGTVLRVDRDGGVAETPYWRPELDRSLAALDLERAAARCIDVAVATYRDRHAGQPYWADLTGGFDSRLLCLLLDRAGVEIRTNTRSAPSPDDTDIARDIAARTGWAWLDNGLPGDWPLRVPPLLDGALGWGDAQLEVLQLARVLHAHARLAHEGPPRLLSAGGGEHLQYYGWQSEFLNAGRSSRYDLGRWVDMLALKPTDASVLAGDPRREVRADIAARCAAWIAPYADELNTTQLELLYAYKSTGHFGAYRSADDGVLTAELPFYAKPVLSTAISISHRHRNGHRLMRAMAAALSPEVAAIRTTRGGPALPWRPSRTLRYAPYVKVVGRKGINKVTERAFGAPLLPQRTAFPWEPAAHGAVLAALRDRGVLDLGAMRIGPLLDRERFAALLDEALQPGFRHSAMLGRVLTAELALRATGTSLDEG